MKRVLCLMLCLTLLGLPCGAVTQAPETALTLSAPSAVLMDSSGTVLFEKNARERLAPASVTKVMTLLLTVEAIEAGQLALTDAVQASAHACSMGGSQVWLEEGETLTVEELLKCVTLASANDCAVALAETVAGSEEAFVTKMNERAAQLGMADTSFVNCCGLDAQGHLTTAYDIALMSRALIAHTWIEQYTTIWQDSIRNGAFTLTNTNKLIRHYDGMIGLKTGSTSTAGFCLSATARRDGMTLIAVVMKAENSTKRSQDICAMLNYGFANYRTVEIQPAEPLPQLPVQLGMKAQVTLELGESGGLLLDAADANGIEQTRELAEQLTAPVKKGQQVGKLIVKKGETVLAEVPILAAEGCPKRTTWQIFIELLRQVGLRKN